MSGTFSVSHSGGRCRNVATCTAHAQATAVTRCSLKLMVLRRAAEGVAGQTGRTSSMEEYQALGHNGGQVAMSA